tara:strand:+ start:300 stop:875 length:576 start_codon:yes stop_codon:yes gene_type:complete
MTFNLIVALDRNYGIGLNNTLPWSLSKDLKNFARLTKGNGRNAIVMGRNTYESIGKPLPKRSNIVLSTKLKDNDNGKIVICKSIYKILEHCLENQYDDVWIIGGATIYNQFLEIPDLIDYIYITLIDDRFGCDSFFNFSQYSHFFTCCSNVSDIDNGYDIKFLKYKKKDIVHYKNNNDEEVWEASGMGKFL